MGYFVISVYLTKRFLRTGSEDIQWMYPHREKQDVSLANRIVVFIEPQPTCEKDTAAVFHNDAIIGDIHLELSTYLEANVSEL